MCFVQMPLRDPEQGGRDVQGPPQDPQVTWRHPPAGAPAGTREGQLHASIGLSTRPRTTGTTTLAVGVRGFPALERHGPSAQEAPLTWRTAPPNNTPAPASDKEGRVGAQVQSPGWEGQGWTVGVQEGPEVQTGRFSEPWKCRRGWGGQRPGQRGQRPGAHGRPEDEERPPRQGGRPLPSGSAGGPQQAAGRLTEALKAHVDVVGRRACRGAAVGPDGRP